MTSSHDRTDEYLRGIEAYRSGQHYEAHEHWEAIWHDEQDEDRNRFLQALIQIASAVHKAKNDVAPRGSLRLADRSLERLEGLGDSYFGIDVAALRRQVGRFRDEVARELENGDGHCQLADDHVPELILSGDVPLWIQGPNQPTVPDAARSSWFERGLKAYADGEYFEAHELWEELWRDEPDPHDKLFLQGLIQVAAAMHKAITQGKPRPAARLLGRALDKLRDGPAGGFGLQIDRLIQEGTSTRRRLLEMAREGDDGQLDESLAPSIVRAVRRL